uniref:CSLREA domain-containing protein n=1 Tax=uncultured Nevskia sp. TaxID=228950 RepID=UPI0025E8F72F
MNSSLALAARRYAVPLLLGAALLPLQSALAANPDLIVTKFTDSLDGSCDSDCSLREAVQKANQTPGASRIILAAGTYSLSIPPLQNPDFEDPLVDDDNNLNGDLDIKGTLTIVGKGIDVTVIDAGRIDRVAEVLPGAVATLSKLTVRNGREPFRGGGLDVNAGGSLSLQSCAVTGNTSSAAFEAGSGGGIWNAGTLSIDASRIDGNRSAAGEGFFGAGGGIYNLGSLTVRDARFIGNAASDDDD